MRAPEVLPQDWSRRARSSVRLRSEDFYTITPIPLYIARRTLVLDILVRYASSASSILDFGCGDGWWLEQLSLAHHGDRAALVGLDPSPAMVQRARARAPDADVYVTDRGIRPNDRHDLVYVVGVLAHMSDETALDALADMTRSLTGRGILLLCEQVAPEQQQGPTYIRRTAATYLSHAESLGLSVELAQRIDFRSHRFFEHVIARQYYRHLAGDGDDSARRIQANRHVLFRWLSRAFLFFDRHPVRNSVAGYGNLVLVARKNEAQGPG